MVCLIEGPVGVAEGELLVLDTLVLDTLVLDTLELNVGDTLLDKDVDVGADEGTVLYNSSRRPAPQYSLLFPGQRKLQSS
jgi:hypothetical protein